MGLSAPCPGPPSRSPDVLRSPRLRIGIAVGMLALSVVGWPVSFLVPERWQMPIVLSLSWLALIWTSVDMILTATVPKEPSDG